MTSRTLALALLPMGCGRASPTRVLRMACARTAENAPGAPAAPSGTAGRYARIVAASSSEIPANARMSPRLRIVAPPKPRSSSYAGQDTRIGQVLLLVDRDGMRLAAGGERRAADRCQRAGRRIDCKGGNIAGVVVRGVEELTGRIDREADRQGAGASGGQQAQGAAGGCNR